LVLDHGQKYFLHNLYQFHISEIMREAIIDNLIYIAQPGINNGYIVPDLIRYLFERFFERGHIRRQAPFE
jgi:hypothetical protein